jgi:hypothetical protein
VGAAARLRRFRHDRPDRCACVGGRGRHNVAQRGAASGGRCSATRAAPAAEGATAGAGSAGPTRATACIGVKAGAGSGAARGAERGGAGEKTGTFCLFLQKMIILPRHQARDKHRDNSKKGYRLLAGRNRGRGVARGHRCAHRRTRRRGPLAAVPTGRLRRRAARRHPCYTTSSSSSSSSSSRAKPARAACARAAAAADTPCGVLSPARTSRARCLDCCRSCRCQSLPHQQGEKTAGVFLSHLHIKMPSFCQDRLGTNIGKTQKQSTVFLQTIYFLGMYVGFLYIYSREKKRN